MRFLSLFSRRSLPDWLLEKGLRVRLLTAVEQRQHAISGAQRSSPIHPLSENTDIPNLEHGKWFIHFLVPRDAFSVLGRIAAGAYPPLQRNTWFGIGLASIVIFTRDEDHVSALSKDPATELVAHERWEIANDGVVVKRTVVCEPELTGTDDGLKLPDLDDSFPADLTGLVEEFEASFRDAYGGASGYSPDELPRLRELFNEVGELVSDLIWLHSTRTSDPPVGLRQFDLGNSLECARLIQQRSDRIVQINSALSYVISQSCFGAPPITTESALVRRHALLGIGRAHRALLNLVREIEEAFRKVSIVRSVEERWSSFGRLPGFDSAGECDSSKWHSLSLPDRLLGEQGQTDIYKLA